MRLFLVLAAVGGCASQSMAPNAFDLSVLDTPVPPDLIEQTPCAARLRDGGICAGADPIGCDIVVPCPMSSASARLCNAGTTATSGTVSGAFYSSDPSKGPAVAICVATTTGSLAPGACEVVTCNGNANTGNIWFRADDNGSNFPATSECGGSDDVSTAFFNCTLP
jgi:hypothetical protein